MEWARVRDWLIGAVAMLLVLMLGVVSLFWVVSDPADESQSETASSPSRDDDGLPGEEPPVALGEDDVWFANLVLTTESVMTANAVLRDVRAVGQDVVTGPDGLVAGSVTADATVPFEVVAEELGGDTVVGPAGGDQAMVSRTVEVLGRELGVVATGTVEVEGNTLVVVPTSIDIGGSEFLADAIAAIVRRLVTIAYDIEGLPEGLMLEDVTVQDDGFRADLRGEDVVLLQ